MPYKTETQHKKIPRELNRTVKLSLEEREEIKQAYGSISQRKLAVLYNVSRSLIRFIGDPDKHKQNLLRRDERGGSMIYYNKDKQRKSTKKTRDYRKLLNSRNLLKT